MSRFVAVVGKNFGDEGKGLAVDYFSRQGKKVLVVRHNGGAQSGHTVEIQGSIPRRFVFHELSSGSFAGADTFWADTFYPDLYKLEEEITEFKRISGFAPSIFAEETTVFTIIDDVLINMAAEKSRGDKRHGSCGMGINECDLRKNAGYGITMAELVLMTEAELVEKLTNIRREYVPNRLKELSLLNCRDNEFIEMLKDDSIIANYAAIVINAVKLFKLIGKSQLFDFVQEYDLTIFESGQGLLLDCDNEEYAPHVTASHTGLDNPIHFLDKLGLFLDEAIFVTRTYITRHGAGKLEGETSPNSLGNIEPDVTNLPNEWQGSIRYAPHKDEKEFLDPIEKEMRKTPKTKAELFVTHTNETQGKIVFGGFSKKAEDMAEDFDRIYLSGTRYFEDVIER